AIRGVRPEPINDWGRDEQGRGEYRTGPCTRGRALALRVCRFIAARRGRPHFHADRHGSLLERTISWIRIYQVQRNPNYGRGREHLKKVFANHNKMPTPGAPSSLKRGLQRR